MDVAALSTAGLSQYVALSSNVGASQKAWQSLAQNLANSNLVAAQTAFNTYQQLSQNSASANNSSQFSNDMAALGKALGSGNLSAAQQAFATVQKDLNGAPSPAVQNAESAVAQTVSWVDDLLGFNNSGSTATSTSDPATAILDSTLGLNTSETTIDPTVALLESKYDAGAADGTPTISTPSDTTSAGNEDSAASVNLYA